ncbi:MAG: hypothetical protein JSR93_01205 [Verrucomicrobia bacterium]|nr:hypothetical protein [Verrucomicrobiota bacterium]
MLTRALPIWQWSLAPHRFRLKILKSLLTKLPIFQVVSVLFPARVKDHLDFAHFLIRPNMYKVEIMQNPIDKKSHRD